MLPPLTAPLNELKSGVLEEVTKDEKDAAGVEPATATDDEADLNGPIEIVVVFALPEAFANKLEGLGWALLSRWSPPLPAPPMALLLVTTP